MQSQVLRLLRVTRIFLDRTRLPAGAESAVPAGAGTQRCAPAVRRQVGQLSRRVSFLAGDGAGSLRVCRR